MSDAAWMDERAGRPVAPGWLVGLVVVGCVAAGVSAAQSLRAAGVTEVSGTLVAERAEAAVPGGALVEPVAAVGQTVVPGDPLAGVRDVRAVEALAAEVSTLEAEAQRRRSRASLAAAERSRGVDAAIHAAEMAAARLMGDRRAAEVEEVAHRERLGGVRTVSLSGGEERYRLMVDLERASATAEACGVQVDLCRSRLAALRAERAAVEAEAAAGFGVAAAVQAAAAKRAELEAALSAEPAVLVSPAHGRVMSVGPGGAVVLDAKRPRVRAELPAEVAVAAAVGTEVEVCFPCGERRAGRVAELAPGVAGDGVPAVIEPVGKRWPAAPAGCAVRVLF